MPAATPSKRWRVITAADTTISSAVDYRSERAAYDAVNALAADRTIAKTGDRITVRHWVDGQWALFEHVKVTENGWEPA